MQLSFSVTERDQNQLELAPETAAVVETLGTDRASSRFDSWVETGDQRHKPHAFKVITADSGEVTTEFRRLATDTELQAIALFENIEL